MGRYIGTETLYNYLFGTVGTIIGAGNVTLTGNQQSLLGTCINNAESAIDDYTRRNFAGTAGTVYYNRYAAGQRAGQALYLDQDLHTLIGVVNGDGATIPLGSVWVEPRNEGPPYRVLRLKSSYVWTFNTDADIIVSGSWGFSTVAPAAIQQATVITAAKFFREKDSGWGPADVAGSPETGELPVARGLPQEAIDLITKYRSRTGGVV